MEQKTRATTLLLVGKVLLSGIIAFVVLTLFCMVYDNMPIHFATSDGVTDYNWEPTRFYCRSTEGISCGYTNNEGYNNLFDYHEDLDIHTLIMGSSHMESYQVMPDESTASELGSLMPDRKVYNIGVSGHNFLVCAQNLPAALRKYAPSVVIIETASLEFADDDLNKLLSGDYPELPSYNGGIVGLFQQNQFLRRIYHQMKDFSGQKAEADADIIAAPAQEPPPKASAENRMLLSALLSQIADTAASSGAKLIIAYHPGTKLDPDGSVTLSTDAETDAAFARLCGENGIYFLDMRDRFLAEYQQNHILPYGFTNTSVGSGHLNKYGHQMMAEELYDLMQEVGL